MSPGSPSRALQLLLVTLCVVAGSRAAPAQTMANPGVVEFDASPDHAALRPDGTPVVTEYVMSVYVAGQSTAVKTVTLGKPAVQPNGKIRVDVRTLMSGFATPGVTYEASVAASGPGGVAPSTVSNPFQFSPACSVGLRTSSYAITPLGGMGSVSLTSSSG